MGPYAAIWSGRVGKWANSGSLDGSALRDARSRALIDRILVCDARLGFRVNVCAASRSHGCVTEPRQNLGLPCSKSTPARRAVAAYRVSRMGMPPLPPPPARPRTCRRVLLPPRTGLQLYTVACVHHSNTISYSPQNEINADGPCVYDMPPCGHMHMHMPSCPCPVCPCYVIHVHIHVHDVLPLALALTL